MVGTTAFRCCSLSCGWLWVVDAAWPPSRDPKTERNQPIDFGFEQKFSNSELSPYFHVPSCLLGLKPHGECYPKEIIFILYFLFFLFGAYFYVMEPSHWPLATPWSPWTCPPSAPHFPVCHPPLLEQASSPILVNCFCLQNMVGCGISYSQGQKWLSLMIYILKHLSTLLFLLFLVLDFSRNTVQNKPSCHFRCSCKQAVCKGWLTFSEHSRWACVIVQASWELFKHVISKKPLKWFPSVERSTG